MSSDSSFEINQQIEESMNLASFGYENAARRFFESFVQGPLYVPERFQLRNLANSPEYPNDFVNILGIQDRDHAVVPVFSDPVYIEKWCGSPLTFKKLSGSALFDSLPEGWWLCVNPGSEVEKEISPWEISLLKGGKEGIDTIIDELFPRESIETLELRPLKEREYSELRLKLKETAATLSEVEKVFLLIEIGKDVDEEEVRTLVIGVQAGADDLSGLEKVRDHFKSMAEQCLIGSGDVTKVLVGSSAEDNLMLGIFNKEQPIYERQLPPDPIGRFKMFIAALKR